MKDQSPAVLKRNLGAPALFGIVQGFIAAGVYFAVGVVAERALGLTWLVFLVGGLLFTLVVLSYVEGASLHQERGGATVIARYGFNELVSFIAGWAICLEYVILIAIAAFATTDYAAVFWDELGSGVPEFVLAASLVLFVAWWNARGTGAPRYERAVLLVLGDLALQLLIVAFGLVLLFEPEVLSDPGALFGQPSLEDLLFAFPFVLVAFSGLDASSGLAGQIAIGRRGLRRLIAVRMLAAIVPYVGIALVASSTLPGEPGGRWIEAPMLGVVSAFEQEWLREPLRYLVAVSAVAVLAAACNAAMLGVSRLGYSLAVNRQLPSRVGYLHPTRSTPVVIIGIGAAAGRAVRALGRPRVPARHLGLRRDGRDHDRLPVGRAAALPRARPRPAVQDAAERAHRWRRAAAAGGGRRRDLRRRVRVRARPSHRRALVGPGLDGVRRARLRDLPPERGQAAAQAHHRAREGADAQAHRGRVRLAAGARARHGARRRHRPDRRAPGRRREPRTSARAAR